MSKNKLGIAVALAQLLVASQAVAVTAPSELRNHFAMERYYNTCGEAYVEMGVMDSEQLDDYLYTMDERYLDLVTAYPGSDADIDQIRSEGHAFADRRIKAKGCKDWLK